MFKVIEKMPDAKIALLKPKNPSTAWLNGKEVRLVLVEERGNNVHVQFFPGDDSKRHQLTFDLRRFSGPLGEITGNDVFLAALVRFSLLQLEAGVGGKTSPMFSVNHLTAAYLRTSLDPIEPAREVIIAEEIFGGSITFEMDGRIFARGEAKIEWGDLKFVLLDSDGKGEISKVALGSGGPINHEVQTVLNKLETLAPRAFEGEQECSASSTQKMTSRYCGSSNHN